MSVRLAIAGIAGIVLLLGVAAVFTYIDALESKIEKLNIELTETKLAQATAELALAEQNLKLTELENALLTAAAAQTKEMADIDKRYKAEFARQKSELSKNSSCERQLELIRESQLDFLGERL